MAETVIRQDWTLDEIEAILQQPFMDLLLQAQKTHRTNFDPNAVQVSTLLSIKTGACPEDCAYCPQSAHFKTGLKKDPLLPVEEVLHNAKNAKEKGATRFCMGAAWRNPNDRDFPKVLDMIRGVKALGLETCVTLGSLTQEQSLQLKQAGLDYYNHNLDTSRTYYEKIITTRNFDDRLATLNHVRHAKINVCSGGILGMGEAREDRVALLMELANMPAHPQSVPINLLVRVEGTPLETATGIDPLDFIRTIATARIIMPTSYLRLSAGRDDMSEPMQAWCFFAGANSIFYGDQLLTTPNPSTHRDRQLFAKLGITPEDAVAHKPSVKLSDEQVNIAP